MEWRIDYSINKMASIKDKYRRAEKVIKDISDLMASFNNYPVKKAKLTESSKKAPVKQNPGRLYVKAMKAKGSTDAQIRRNLKTKGWSDRQIEVAFKGR